MEICRQAFEKDLMAAIDKDAEAKKVQVKVETRNTSIIVKTENGQEYIALDKNADISVRLMMRIGMDLIVLIVMEILKLKN